MGSFINELAKGFVRSAVNQVGRDAGRVVSNNIYGDAHSIPHRNVSTGGAGRVSSVGKVENEETVIIEPSEGKAIAWCVVALFFNFLGAVILLVVGYRKLKTNTLQVLGFMNPRRSMSLMVATRLGSVMMVTS